MLPRKYRLKKRKDFKRIYSSGKKINQGVLLFRFLENGLSNPRIGIVVSKKILAKATDRNLVKRRIREAVRVFLPEFSRNFDIIITVGKGVSKSTSLEEFRTLIKQAFVKIETI